LAGEEFVLGIEPLLPPARIVFGRLEIEVVDVLAHLAAKSTSLIMLWMPDDKNSTPEHPMGAIPGKHSQSVMKHAMCRIVLGFRS
jgi:hypothetical protein